MEEKGPDREVRFDLRSLGLLGGPPDRSFDASVRLASAMAATPLALLVIIDHEADLLCLRAHVGLSPAEETMTRVRTSRSLYSHLTSSTDVVAIPDITLDPRTRTNSVAASLGVRSLMAAPVRSPADDAVGLLSVLDRVPRIWSAQQRAALCDIAHMATQAILLRAALHTVTIMSRTAGTGPERT
jgi:GAF domain-containing protein